MRTASCPFCKGTIEDLYTFHDDLIKLNIIPVICYAEPTENFKEFLEEVPKYSVFYSICQRPYKKIFKLHNQSLFELMLQMLKLMEAGNFMAATYGIKFEKKYFKYINFSDRTQVPAIFVIYQNKIISETRKQYFYQRFDITKIIIDPSNNFGIEIKNYNYECKYMPKLLGKDNKNKIIIKDVPKKH